MKTLRIILLGIMFISLPSLALAISDSNCVKCHSKYTPGIVSEFLISEMGKAGMDCSDCHGDEHTGLKDWSKALMPTAETCGTCHEEKLQQFRRGKHNLGWFAMKSQEAWHHQPPSIVKEGYRGCSGCHKIGEKGLIGLRDGNPGALKRDGGKEISQYRYGNAQCDACHTRHSFKEAEAKDPRACSNCHMGFDHPQYEMYISSKHGIMWEADGYPTDGRAPTCQSCHMDGSDHEVATPWGFLGLRIPTKENVLALIDKLPHMKENLEKLAAQLPSGHYEGVDDDPEWTLHRAVYLQAAGVLDENLQPTERFVEIVLQARAARGPEEFNRLRRQMKKRCNKCHSSKYIDDFFNAGDTIIKEIDRVYAKAIMAVQGLYRDGILKKPEGWKYAPDLLRYYDAKTGVEQDLYLIFLEHRQRAFQGAFHVSNDYMHWYGWAPLNETVNRILEEVERMRAEHAKK